MKLMTRIAVLAFGATCVIAFIVVVLQRTDHNATPAAPPPDLQPIAVAINAYREEMAQAKTLDTSMKIDMAMAHAKALFAERVRGLDMRSTYRIQDVAGESTRVTCPPGVHSPNGADSDWQGCPASFARLTLAPAESPMSLLLPMPAEHIAALNAGEAVTIEGRVFHSVGPVEGALDAFKVNYSISGSAFDDEHLSFGPDAIITIGDPETHARYRRYKLVVPEGGNPYPSLRRSFEEIR